MKYKLTYLMDRDMFVYVIMKQDEPIAVFYDYKSALEFAKVQLASSIKYVPLLGVVKDLVTPTLAISIEPPF